MILAVLVGTERGREAVGKWVTDPSRFEQEAALRIKVRSDRLEPVRNAIKPAARSHSGETMFRAAPLPPPAESEPAPSAPVAPAPAAAAPAPPPPVAPPPLLAEILIQSAGVPTGLTAAVDARDPSPVVTACGGEPGGQNEGGAERAR